MIPSSILENNFVNALVWMIIHSFWQFTAIALIMSIVLKKFSTHHSLLRYNIALSSLGLTILTGLFTFLYYYFESVTETNSVYISNMSFQYLPNSYDGLPRSIFEFIDLYRLPIFIAWIIGVLVFLLKFIISMMYVEFLSKTSLPIHSQEAYKAFKKIYNHLNIKQNIQLGQSKYIKSPMILGFFKPIILFPIGIINMLDIAETEAILAHELAHFVRKDILINIIQTLVEVIFYYHPAIWWISTNIKVERENCCDDLAIKYVRNNLHYAKTLVKMQELMSGHSPVLAMNFSNKDSFFSSRIKRILNMTQTRNYLKEKIITSLGIILLVMFISKTQIGNAAVASTPNGNNSEAGVTQMVEIKVLDTLPFKKESIIIQKKTNDKEIKISMEDGKVTDLEINGKKIEEKDFDKYEDEIANIKPRSMGQGDNHMFFFGDSGSKPFEFNFGNGNFMDSMMGKFDFGNMEEFRFDHGKLNENMQKLQEQMDGMKFDLKGMDSMAINLGHLDLLKDLQHHPGMKFFHFDNEYPGTYEQYDEFNKDYENDVENDFPGRLEGYLGYEKDRIDTNFSENIGNMLNRDGLLIPGQENKVELSGKYLKINGEKQPSNIWNKYKRIFEEQSGTSLQKNSKLEFKFLGKESKRKYKVY